MRQRKQRTAQQRTKQQKKHKTIDYTFRGDKKPHENKFAKLNKNKKILIPVLGLFIPLINRVSKYPPRDRKHREKYPGAFLYY